MVDQLAVIGCGLIGGSFAHALRAAGGVRRIVGHSRSPDSAQQALRLGCIDAVAGSAAQAAAGADVVLLAVPVAATGAVLGEIRPVLGAHTLCMDVGSTKLDVVAAARASLGDRLAAFVPAHPIAGGERAGVEHSDAGLFKRRQVILTPLEQNPPALRHRARELWQAVGATVLEMEAAAHDDAFAAVSHLPHLLAYAYFEAVAAQPDAADLLALAGPGFRDFTRIAAGEPTMWRDILLANRERVLRHGQQLRASLDRLEALLREGDADALHERLRAVSRQRSAWRMRGTSD